VTTITATTTDKQAPRWNRLTGKNHPQPHPRSRRSRPDSGVLNTREE